MNLDHCPFTTRLSDLERNRDKIIANPKHRESKKAVAALAETNLQIIQLRLMLARPHSTIQTTYTPLHPIFGNEEKGMPIGHEKV